jgi:hypothetical protein
LAPWAGFFEICPSRVSDFLCAIFARSFGRPDCRNVSSLRRKSTEKLQVQCKSTTDDESIEESESILSWVMRDWHRSAARGCRCADGKNYDRRHAQRGAHGTDSTQTAR